MFYPVTCFIGRQDCSVWSVLRLNYRSCWGNFFKELELLIFNKKLNSTEGIELLKSCVVVV